ncbi:hypothetical protein V8F06_001724 [Rhypophila decipiens]
MQAGNFSPGRTLGLGYVLVIGHKISCTTDTEWSTRTKYVSDLRELEKGNFLGNWVRYMYPRSLSFVIFAETYPVGLSILDLGFLFGWLLFGWELEIGYGQVILGQTGLDGWESLFFSFSLTTHVGRQDLHKYQYPTLMIHRRFFLIAPFATFLPLSFLVPYLIECPFNQVCLFDSFTSPLTGVECAISSHSCLLIFCVIQQAQASELLRLLEGQVHETPDCGERVSEGQNLVTTA